MEYYRETMEYYRKPTPGEIRFGEGALHYLGIPLAECVKPNGDVKRWVKISGIRYYCVGWYKDKSIIND